MVLYFCVWVCMERVAIDGALVGRLRSGNRVQVHVLVRGGSNLRSAKIVD